MTLVEWWKLYSKMLHNSGLVLVGFFLLQTERS